ncbi:MAG: hypothetical protein JW804_01655 [Sedimentisphaerales bacterium]|nr:hypothetical protein [Sedimentisphaerales bacterium]
MIKKPKLKLFNLFCLLLAVLFLFGCEPPQEISLKQCPGKATIQESLQTLQASSSQIQPFIAYGSGLVHFYDEEEGKPKKETISAVKIWFEPPDKFRFWGDVVFDKRGLDVGSNEQEFWFTARPKEIGNVYIWGLWAEQKNEDDLLISPKVMRQAFGFINVDSGQNWTLTPGRYQDVLTQRGEQNRIIRRIHIDNCEYRVRQVEYFDSDENVFAVLNLDDFKNVDEKMAIPSKIQIVNLNDDGNSDIIDITVKSVKPQDIMKQALFARPGTKRFKNVYKLINGKAVEQPQQ